MMRRKKVLLFGGNFDPPHFGHINAARIAFNSGKTSYDSVWFLPCCSNAFGLGRIYGSASVYHRLNMLNLAVSEYVFKVSDFEAKMYNKPGPYTVVKAIINEYPHIDFTYLVGMDSVPSIRRWRNSRKLVKTLPFLTVPSKGTKYCETNWFRIDPHHYVMKGRTDKSYSSTIRKEARNNNGKMFRSTVQMMLLQKVQDYIIENNLYRAEQT